MPTTPWQYATRVAANPGAYATPNNTLGAPNGTTATASVTTSVKTIELADYNFAADIPSEFIFEGIELQLVARAATASVVRVNGINLYSAGAYQGLFFNDNGASYVLPSTLTSKILTGVDAFGDQRFKAALRGNLTVAVPLIRSTTGTTTGYIDAVGMRVTWQEAKVKNHYVKHNGIWKAVDTHYVRHNGVWKDGQQWVKHNGIWKKVYGA